MAQTEWMENYKDRELGKMHLPGSHDAGIIKKYIDFKGGNTANTATQTLTVTEQLNAGTRFFDLRLSEYKKQIVVKHTAEVFGKDTGMGGYSQTPISKVLEDARDFCQAHTSEVVIFRISHTKLSTKADEIIATSAKGALHTGKGNLCLKTLEEILQDGGLICILEEKKFGSVIKQSAGIHGYTKYEGTATKRGISCCGCYSGTHKLAEVVRNGLKGQYDHNEKHNPIKHDHLWQVYWQKTYLNPFHKTSIESGTTKKAVYRYSDGKVHGGTHAATDYMIKLMKGLGTVGKEDYQLQKEKSHDKKVGPIKAGPLAWKKVIDEEEVMYSTLGVRDYTLPNIFSYDFVNEHINKKIIKMNDKELQKVEDDE